MNPSIETIEFDRQECVHCGMIFWVPRNFMDIRRQDHLAFTCPAGHTQCYKKPTEAPEVTKLKGELASTRIRISSLRGTTRIGTIKTQ